MNASEELWRQWSGQLRAFLPEVHGHRSKTLAFCVLGVVLAGSTRLPRVAEALVGVSAAKTPSSERRLARFLANQQIIVVPLWTHLLGQFLRFWRDRRLVFVLDATSLDERATVLYLGLLVQSRLLPVSWQVLPVHDPWEQRQWEVVGALLDRVIPHLGTAACTLLADRGLVGHPLVQLCQQRGWHSVLRLSAAHTCQPQRGRWARGWIPCRPLVPQRGRQWYGAVRLWQERPLATQISATWEPERKEPWIVVSDQPAGRQRVREYARRMRVESTFQDLKRRGWDLEGTVIADRARLHRLLLVVFLSLWWLAHLAASCVHHGQITGNAPASTAMTAGTRASFASDGFGCSICCAARSPKQAYNGAYHFEIPPRDGRSRSASKKCQGESHAPPARIHTRQVGDVAKRLHRDASIGRTMKDEVEGLAL